jgi:hypothetical protein
MHQRDAGDDIVPPFLPGPPTMAMPPALVALHDHIVGDLRATQGAWRERTWPARFAPLLVAVVAAVTPWILLHPRALSFAGMLAAGAGVLAFVAIATATQKPLRGSVLGTLATALGGVAAALEGFSEGDPAVVRPLLSCALTQAALFLPPAVLVAWHLRRAYLPARRGHLAAAGGAGLFACAVVWCSCLDGRAAHRLLEHSVSATVLLAGCAGCAQIWLRRRSVVSIELNGGVAARTEPGNHYSADHRQ